MNIRQFFNKYGVFIIIGSLVVAVLAYWLLIPRQFRTTVKTSAYFIDEETGEETARSMAEIPPLSGKSGNMTIVLEIKYSCDGGKTSKPLYYSKYTDAARQELLSLPANDAGADTKRQKLMTNSRLIRSPDPGSRWIPANSPEADRLREMPACPSGNPPIVVQPS